jgi:hypothetical protein
MFNLPIPECWQKFKRTGDLESLVRFVESDTTIRNLPEWIHFIAIGTADWKVVERLEAAGVGLPAESETESLIWGVMETFGDVPETVRWLAVTKGASTHIRGFNDWTPLHYAANCGYVHCVRELIALGADVNAITNIDGGWTPLMRAAAMGQVGVVEALLESGADQSIVNTYGAGKAVDIARKKKHEEIVLLLEGKNLDPWKGKRKRS